MHHLLERAQKEFQQVELWNLNYKSNIVIFENAILKDIDSKSQSGISIRILDDRKEGFAYTKNLIDEEEFIANSQASLKGNIPALYRFPETKQVQKLNTYDPSIEQISNAQIIEECKRVCEYLTSKVDAQINLWAITYSDDLHLLNSAGTDLSLRTSLYSIMVTLIYPHSYSAIGRSWPSKNFTKISDRNLDYIAKLYHQSSKIKTIKSGRMKVLFMPETIPVIMSRLQSGTSGASLYQKKSPLVKKIDTKIANQQLSVINDPLDDTKSGARSFDDEGVPTKRFAVLEKGTLKNFYYDLNYGQKMRTRSTGHGFKSGSYNRETITIKPTPALEHLYIEKGDKSFNDLVKLMDKGIIVAGALGAHSGNIPNGDFSIGLAPGLYVEAGEIIGRVRDTMVAGNIYDIMKNIVAIEDTIHATGRGHYPAIIFDDVNVSSEQ